MVTTVISTVDVQTNHILTPDSSYRLFVSHSGSIVWDGNSGIEADPTAVLCLYEIYGAVSLDHFYVGNHSILFVSETGSIATNDLIYIGGHNYGGHTVFENHGTVQTYDNGLAAQGNSCTVLNFGTMNLYLGVRFGQYSQNGQIFNSGSIYSKNVSLRVESRGSTIENSGKIISEQYAITISGEYNGATSSLGITLAPTQAYCSNSGEIWGLNTGVSAEMLLAESEFTLNNTGMIGGRSFSIHSSSGTDTIINSGLLNGNVSLGGGNDIFDTRGGTVIGTVDGGSGSDTYYTDDALLAIIETTAEIDTVNAAVTFRLANFVENLTLLGTGNFNGFGNTSANVMTGNAGDNRLTGLAGNDTMNGDLGDDRMLGGVGNDTMLGGDGDDVMLGGVGNDTARGEDGDDVLNGLAGTDLLAGGAGLDTFVFSALGHTTTSTATADTVSDFIKGEDHIDLSAIDAITTNAVPNDTFIFIGTAAFSNVAGQLRYSQAAGYTNIEMDVDGNSTVDGIVRLFGTLSLNASDFVL